VALTNAQRNAELFSMMNALLTTHGPTRPEGVRFILLGILDHWRGGTAQEKEAAILFGDFIISNVMGLTPNAATRHQLRHWALEVDEAAGDVFP
jgi:hypothetical protein